VSAFDLLQETIRFTAAGSNDTPDRPEADREE